MRAWILIATIVIGLLLVTGVVMAIVDSNNQEESQKIESTQTCLNPTTCTQSNNCGRADCGAIQGRSCGCGG